LPKQTMVIEERLPFLESQLWASPRGTINFIPLTFTISWQGNSQVLTPFHA